MEKEEKKTIYVIQNLWRGDSLRGCETAAYWLEDGSYVYMFNSKRVSRAEAILDYDLSGRKEPLYDNTEGYHRFRYFPKDLRKMKRLR